MMQVAPTNDRNKRLRAGLREAEASEDTPEGSAAVPISGSAVTTAEVSQVETALAASASSEEEPRVC